MQTFNLSDASPINLQRRSFIAQTGKTTLSATAIALLSGSSALLGASAVTAATNPSQDANILNSALAAEQEAIAAYQVAADSGLLVPDIRKVALQFQGHHKEHADHLAKTVKTLGGEPGDPWARYDFPLEQLKNQSDVLEFAAGLEKGAVSAYLGAVPTFADRALAKAAASILGDEAMHWAVLRQVLGQDPVPVAFVS